MSGYVCPTCYQPIRFIPEYQRWFCDRCRVYPTYSVPAPQPSSTQYQTATSAPTYPAMGTPRSQSWTSPSSGSGPAATSGPPPSPPAQSPVSAGPAPVIATAVVSAAPPRTPAREAESRGHLREAARLYGEEGATADRARCLSDLAHNLEAEGDLASAASTHEEAGRVEDAARVKASIEADAVSRPLCPECGATLRDAGELRHCPKCDRFVGSRAPRWAQAFEFPAGASIRCVAVSPDGELIAAGSADHNVYAFDSKGALAWKFATGDRVGRVSISGDRSVVAAGSADRHLYILDGQGNLQARIPVPTPVCGVATTADGYLVAAGSEKELLVFDRQGHRLWKYAAAGFVTDVSMAAGGSLVAAACSDGALHALGRLGNVMWSTNQPALSDTSMSGDGRFIACFSEDGTLVALDEHGSALFREKVDDPGMRDAVHLVKVSHDGSLLAASAGRVVCVFDRSGRRLLRYTAPHRITGLAISGDGRLVAGVSTPPPGAADADAAPGVILVFDRGGRLAWREAAGGAPYRIALSQDGAILACGSEDQTLRVYRLVREGDALAAANAELEQARGLAKKGDTGAADALLGALGLEVAEAESAAPPPKAAAEESPSPVQDSPALVEEDQTSPHAAAPSQPGSTAPSPGRQAAFDRYRRAVRRAIEDDRVIDDKERGFLDDLREAWGIDQLTAARIEEEERKEFQLHPPKVERVARGSIAPASGTAAPVPALSDAAPPSPRDGRKCVNCGNVNPPSKGACEECGLLLG